MEWEAGDVVKHGNGIGQAMQRGDMTVTEFAAHIGVSVSTVRNWTRAGALTPRRKRFGRLSVAVYGQQCIRQAAEQMKGGNTNVDD